MVARTIKNAKWECVYYVSILMMAEGMSRVTTMESDGIRHSCTGRGKKDIALDGWSQSHGLAFIERNGTQLHGGQGWLSVGSVIASCSYITRSD